MEANFYAISNQDIQKVLGLLLEKACSVDKKSYVIVQNEVQAKEYDIKLWNAFSWLPHCMKGEKQQEETPIVIVIDDKYSSIIHKQSTLLFIIDEVEYNDVEGFEKVYVLFNAKDDNILKINRKRWKDWQKIGHFLRFFKQNTVGKFEETNI